MQHISFYSYFVSVSVLPFGRTETSTFPDEGGMGVRMVVNTSDCIKAVVTSVGESVTLETATFLSKDDFPSQKIL